MAIYPSGMFSQATSFNGDISKWDVSSVKSMSVMFSMAVKFNGDISKWDVSLVFNMYGMFLKTKSFNCDLSRWNVYNVANMNSMFSEALSFKQILCGSAWVQSTASKDQMFFGSHGQISQSMCAVVSSSLNPHAYVTRRPNPERELIVRAPITTAVSTNTLAIDTTNKMACPKCGTFKKSGRASCCAPGGAWYKNCGGIGNKHVGHSWSEGAQACQCKFNVNAM